jgi:hypothetical protein
MNVYRVEKIGDWFHVIEVVSGAQEKVVARLTTEIAARAWILKRLSITDPAELERWLRGST